jgi:hypothetical protein
MENLSVLVLDFDPTSLLAISNTLEKVNFKGEFQFSNLKPNLHFGALFPVLWFLL